ncbi:unnamed protein product [Allacma fusca]|uniref:Uncharacterized protein n=1 Tax=Allacma fusca TaxID=39272 RepID=A0A8J2KS71_9HEXA|nr:unnamed protein product [Allacma fusca]
MILHQTQLAAGISAIGKAVSQVVKIKTVDNSEKEIRLEAVKALNDAGRLLTDLQFKLSLARRAHITPTLNFLMKTIADQNPVGVLLVEASKSISKVGKELRKEKPPILSRKKHTLPIALRLTNRTPGL